MKALLTLLAVMFVMVSYGQHYDYGKLDTTIYNPETGQYWYRSQGFDWSENILSSEEYFMGQQIFHRFRIEVASKFPGSKFGFWGLGSYNKPLVKNEWISKGYYYNNSYILELGFALRYEKDSCLSYFLGIGGSTGKRFMGPIAGFTLKKDKITIKATALYSALCYFKESYSEEWIQKHQEQIEKYGMPPTINGFDPNSWYSVSLLWKADKVSSIGLTSERFYGTRFLYQYAPEIKGLHWNQMKLYSSLGWNFEFKNFVASMGISLNLF